jgi:hypothetical protein
MSNSLPVPFFRSNHDQEGTFAMPDIKPDSESLNKSGLDFLDTVGGEPLEGSGFEAEIPEPDSDWSDPR